MTKGKNITDLGSMMDNTQVFRCFFDNSLVGYSIILSNGKMYLNRVFAEMLGYTETQLTNIRWQDIVHPDDVATTEAKMGEITSGKVKEAHLINRYIRKDRSIMWGETHGSMLPALENSSYLFSIIDISQRIKTQEQLDDLNTRYQTFLNFSSDMIFLKDKDFRYVFANQTMIDFLSIRREKIIGSTDTDILGKAAVVGCHKTDLLALARDGVVSSIEKMGDKVFESRKFKVPMQDGSFGIGAYLREITLQTMQAAELTQNIMAKEIIANCLIMPFKNTQEHLDYVLIESLKLTDSEYGLIYLFDDNTSELTLSSWTKNVDENCRILDKQIRHKLWETGAWADTVKLKSPLIINDFLHADMFQKGFPQGHIPIRRFISIPLFDNGKLVAMVGYANKPTDYDQDDVKTLSILMTGIWNIIQRSVDENKMARILAQKTSMFNNHEAVMLLLEPESGRIVDCNPAAIAFYGYSKAELQEMSIQQINKLPEPEVKALRLKALKKGKKYFTFPHQLKNGDVRYVDVYSSPIPYDDKTLLFSIIFDVTDRERAYEENKYISSHDYLTGLYNRRYFETQFEQLNKAGNYPLALIMGDVNNLKIINDSMGHDYGDSLLIRAAELFQADDIRIDIAARVGGDEFALLKTATNEIEIREIVKKLEQNMELQTETEKGKPILSVALGYAIQKDPGDRLNDLMRIAESFVYANKYFDEKSLKGQTVNVVMNALFEKSAREKGHSLRVGKISAHIATRLGMVSSDVNRIKTAGYLHDIGKIGIPDHILNKEGKLNEEEWKIMKSHVGRSYRILQNSGEFANLGEIVYSHHERWDGTGYPRGLKGERIPFEARILALADAFDAMTSNRTYHQKRTNEEAIDEIKHCSGKQFDPKLATIFIDIVKNEKL